MRTMVCSVELLQGKKRGSPTIDCLELPPSTRPSTRVSRKSRVFPGALV